MTQDQFQRKFQGYATDSDNNPWLNDKGSKLLTGYGKGRDASAKMQMFTSYDQSYPGPLPVNIKSMSSQMYPKNNLQIVAMGTSQTVPYQLPAHGLHQPSRSSGSYPNRTSLAPLPTNNSGRVSLNGSNGEAMLKAQRMSPEPLGRNSRPGAFVSVPDNNSSSAASVLPSTSLTASNVSTSASTVAGSTNPTAYSTPMNGVKSTASVANNRGPLRPEEKERRRLNYQAPISNSTTYKVSSSIYKFYKLTLPSSLLEVEIMES